MFRQFGAALIAIRRSPYQALSAVLILWITFFVGYIFSVFVFSTEKLLQYFETRPQITAYFKLDTQSDTIQTLEQTMRNKPYVDAVHVLTKEQALQIYREDNKKDPLMLELVTADILPASIEVSAKSADSLSQIKSDLDSARGVDEVVYQKDLVETLQKWTTSIRYLGIASISVLAITSFFIVMIITGMKVATKKRAIQIMKIIGASGWYIQSPFVFEGMVYGFIGSIVGWVAMFILLQYMTPWLQQFLGAIPLLPLPIGFFLVQFAGGTVLGIFLGAFASSISVQRMMRRA